MKQKLIPAVFSSCVAFLLLTGCATTGGNDDIPAMQVNDPLLSPAIAKGITQNDDNKIQQLIATAGSRQTVSWQGDNGNMFQFTSLKIFVNGKGQPCRSYQIQAHIGGEKQEMQTTACRGSDGNWTPVNS